MQEEMGYIEGGSRTLVDALVADIEKRGGRIHLGCGARRVHIANGRVHRVESASGDYPADDVISTIPIPLVPSVIPDLPEDLIASYRAIKNIGVCCVVMKLARSVSRHFWINVEDENIDIPGVIEFTNLREVGASIIYVPYYMPASQDKFAWTDEQFIVDAMSCLMRLNPEIREEDLIESRVFRLRHAQPLCDVGFGSKLPPVQTCIEGLQIADTCFYYPEDRSISESVRMGRWMATRVGGQHGR
jgi:protoporphyrinogen oxidase